MNVDIVLFSSNYRPEYMQDNLRILAYPSGHIMHYRYRTKWVDKALLSDLENEDKRKGLRGKDVLIITIGNSMPSSNRNSWQFYPIRKGSIVDIYEKNGVVHVYFQLSDKLVGYDINTQINLTSNLRSSFSSYATYFTSLSKVVQNIISTNLEEKPLEEQWDQLVDILSNDPDFREVLFYRFEILSTHNQETQIIKPTIHDRISLKSEYKVSCSEEYILKIYIRENANTTIKSDSKLIVESTTSNIIIMPSKIPIWLIADEKNILLKIRTCAKYNLAQIIIKGDNIVTAYIDDIFLHLQPKLFNREELLLTMFAVGLLLSSGAIGIFAQVFPLSLKLGAWTAFVLTLFGILLSTIAIAKLSSQNS